MAFSATSVEYETVLNGLFKKIYSKDGLQNLIPAGIKAIKMVPFREAEKIGEDFNFPVRVQHPQSVTYAASESGAFALNDIVPGQTKNVQVDGSQLIIRDAMDYESAAKAASGGEKSFVAATRYMIESMVEQASKRLEIQFFYGRSPLGTVSSMTDADTSTVITITDATFAPLIWSGMVGARLALYSDSTGKAGHSTNDLYITAVDIVNKTVTCTGNATEIDAAYAVGTAGSGLNIYFKSAYSKDFYGIDQILTNSGTLFGVSAATYDLWTGSSYSAGSADLTLKKIERAAALGCSKGGLDGDAICFVSNTTWANSISDQAALRAYDKSYSKDAENGFESLKIWGLNGLIEVIPSGYVKEGEAFLLPKDGILRIGATDLTFKIPGQGGKDDERFFFPVADYAGFEVRAYSHQAIVMKKPAQGVKITNIVNS